MSEPDRAETLQQALRVALAGKSVVVASVLPPHGQLRLDRAAVAQHEAIAAQADAAVWIDVEGSSVDICVVSADGSHFRHAPLPSGESSARVFAAIATSLLDEMIAPPEGDPSIHVDVHVNVGHDGVDVTTSPGVHATVTPSPDPLVAPRGASGLTPLPTPRPTPAPVPFAAPGSYPAVAPAPPVAQVDDSESGPIRSNRTLVEFGPMLSPLTAGIEASLMFPASRSWRIGAMGAANVIFDGGDPLFAGALEVRHVGTGRRHFDIGFLGGAATAEGDTVGFTGMRLQLAWERASHSTAISLAPVLFIADGMDPMPGAYASLRWGLPI
jgi:hypothetical protein